MKTSYGGFDGRAPTSTRKCATHASASHCSRIRHARSSPGVYRAYLAPSSDGGTRRIALLGGFSGRALATGKAACSGCRTMPQRSTRRSPSPRTSPMALRRHSRTRVSRARARPNCSALAAGRVARQPAHRQGIRIGNQRCQCRRDAGGARHGGWHAARSPSLAALDTGIYVGNLWYLNFSDRPACRITGMTRFASFWVEHGKIVAPVNVMRSTTASIGCSATSWSD